MVVDKRKLVSNGPAEVIEPCDIALGRMIGTGRTAEVFLGLWNGKQVAIKQLYEQRMNESEAIAFQREVSILVNVNHPNLVRLLGYCMSSAPKHLVCEYCEGGTLFEMLHNQRDLDLALVQQVKMCTDIAHGMDYLHKFTPQIVHRDLKSLNLLLTKQLTGLGDIPVVKVTDFGLARVVEPHDQKLTSYVGTVHWMAPEMFDSRSYDEKVDVYSYGIVVFEMFAREPPFEDRQQEEIEHLVKKGTRPTLEAVPQELPLELKDIMITSWAQNPRDRPSFGNILQALSSVHCRVGLAPRRPSPASLVSASGYLSKTRAMGQVEFRAVSL